MASTYTLISSQVLGSSAASVTFSSIPQTYKDLKLVWSARTDRASFPDYIYFRFNGSSSAVYSATSVSGNGSGAYSSYLANQNIGGNVTPVNTANTTTNTFGCAEMYLPNYATNAAKQTFFSGVAENNSANAAIAAEAELFNSASAITSITLSSYSSSNIVANSSFYLYGI